MILKRNHKNKHVLAGYSIVLLLMLILAMIFREHLKLIYSNPELVKDFIAGFGLFGPFVLILLQTLQVIILVIPGPVFTIAGGYAFGTVMGTIYSLVGTLFGSIVVFHLGRTYGRPFIEKLVNKKDLDHFDVYLKKRGEIGLFITRTMPILFPNDVVSFVASLTKMPLKRYAIISFIGFIPNILLLNVFGSRLSEGMTPLTLILLSIVGFGLLAFLFRHPLKLFLLKEIKAFEKEASKLKELESITL